MTHDHQGPCHGFGAENALNYGRIEAELQDWRVPVRTPVQCPQDLNLWNPWNLEPNPWNLEPNPWNLEPNPWNLWNPWNPWNRSDYGTITHISVTPIETRQKLKLSGRCRSA
jgi:hypothetical protein